MKKTTVLLIFIIYVASIVVIGFFGMSVKVYDEIKYVKSIEMSVEAESSDMFELKYNGIDAETKNPEYTLRIYFTKSATTGTFKNSEGVDEEKQYLPLNLIPKVTYDTGDVAGNAENIKYTISNQKLIDNNSVILKDNGTLICFKSGFAFYIYVNPASKGGNGTGANLHVFVF